MGKRIEMFLKAIGMRIMNYLLLDNCRMLMLCIIDFYANRVVMNFTSLIVFH